MNHSDILAVLPCVYETLTVQHKNCQLKRRKTHIVIGNHSQRQQSQYVKNTIDSDV